MATFFKNCRKIISDMPTRLHNAGITSNESCENCHSNFNIIRKKRACSKCLRWFCVDCLAKREMVCRACGVLDVWPVHRMELLELKARDIKAFLTANGVSTHGCVEKEELVELALRYLSNRQQTAPSTARRVSTREVDDAWVLVNEVTSSPSSPNQEVPSSSQDVPQQRQESSQPSSPTENTSPPVAIPDRLGLEATSPVSTSLPQLNSMDAAAVSEEAALSSSLSESQPNLHRPMETCEGGSSSSQLNAVHSIVSMSRTDLTTMSDEDLQKLSIRNLKVVLAAHRVDFRGCCEKEELLERARRLKQQLQAQAKIDVDELSDANLCKVCMAAPIDCVLLDCGHLVACTPCGKQMNECPVCRQYVIRVVKTFRA